MLLGLYASGKILNGCKLYYIDFLFCANKNNSFLMVMYDYFSYNEENTSVKKYSSDNSINVLVFFKCFGSFTLPSSGRTTTKRADL